MKQYKMIPFLVCMCGAYALSIELEQQDKDGKIQVYGKKRAVSYVVSHNGPGQFFMKATSHDGKVELPSNNVSFFPKKLRFSGKNLSRKVFASFSLPENTPEQQGFICVHAENKDEQRFQVPESEKIETNKVQSSGAGIQIGMCTEFHLVTPSSSQKTKYETIMNNVEKIVD
jgi:hypothetical protein